jgi:hypothetical protein
MADQSLSMDLGLLEGRPIGLIHDIAGVGGRGAWVGPSLTPRTGGNCSEASSLGAP